MAKPTNEEFCRTLETVMEAAPGSVTGGEALKDLPQWDSLAVISFIALADSKYGISISAKALQECKSVPDLMAILGDKPAG